MTFPGANPYLIPGLTPVTPGVGGTQFVSAPGGGPSMPASPKGQPVIYPWWQWEMPGSSDFEINALNFAAVAASTTAVPGFSYTVSSGNKGVLAFLQFTVQNPLVTSLIQARLLINGAPVQGWGAIAIPPLAATAFVQPFNGMVVRLSENQTLTAVVVVTDAVTYTCSLQARGWTTPLNVIQQFMSGVPY